MRAPQYSPDCMLWTLEESKIYDNATLSLNLPRLCDNVDTFTYCAFTEKLNNAIEYPEAGDGYIKFQNTSNV